MRPSNPLLSAQFSQKLQVNNRPRVIPRKDAFDEYEDEGADGEALDSEGEYYNKNYKQEIEKILGPKRRFVEPDYSDDDRMMEVGFAGIEMEERRSAKLARLEDKAADRAERDRKKRKLANN